MPVTVSLLNVNEDLQRLQFRVTGVATARDFANPESVPAGLDSFTGLTYAEIVGMLVQSTEGGSVVTLRMPDALIPASIGAGTSRLTDLDFMHVVTFDNSGHLLLHSGQRLILDRMFDFQGDAQNGGVTVQTGASLEFTYVARQNLWGNKQINQTTTLPTRRTVAAPFTVTTETGGTINLTGTLRQAQGFTTYNPTWTTLIGDERTPDGSLYFDLAEGSVGSFVVDGNGGNLYMFQTIPSPAEADYSSYSFNAANDPANPNSPTMRIFGRGGGGFYNGILFNRYNINNVLYQGHFNPSATPANWLFSTQAMFFDNILIGDDNSTTTPIGTNTNDTNMNFVDMKTGTSINNALLLSTGFHWQDNGRGSTSFSRRWNPSWYETSDAGVEVPIDGGIFETYTYGTSTNPLLRTDGTYNYVKEGCSSGLLSEDGTQNHPELNFSINTNMSRVELVSQDRYIANDTDWKASGKDGLLLCYGRFPAGSINIPGDVIFPEQYRNAFVYTRRARMRPIVRNINLLNPSDEFGDYRIDVATRFDAFWGDVTDTSVLSLGTAIYDGVEDAVIVTMANSFPSWNDVYTVLENYSNRGGLNRDVGAANVSVENRIINSHEPIVGGRMNLTGANVIVVIPGGGQLFVDADLGNFAVTGAHLDTGKWLAFGRLNNTNTSATVEGNITSTTDVRIRQSINFTKLQNSYFAERPELILPAFDTLTGSFVNLQQYAVSATGLLTFNNATDCAFETSTTHSALGNVSGCVFGSYSPEGSTDTYIEQVSVAGISADNVYFIGNPQNSVPRQLNLTASISDTVSLAGTMTVTVSCEDCKVDNFLPAGITVRDSVVNLGSVTTNAVVNNSSFRNVSKVELFGSAAISTGSTYEGADPHPFEFVADGLTLNNCVVTGVTNDTSVTNMNGGEFTGQQLQATTITNANVTATAVRPITGSSLVIGGTAAVAGNVTAATITGNATVDGVQANIGTINEHASIQGAAGGVVAIENVTDFARVTGGAVSITGTMDGSSLVHYHDSLTITGLKSGGIAVAEGTTSPLTITQTGGGIVSNGLWTGVTPNISVGAAVEQNFSDVGPSQTPTRMDVSLCANGGNMANRLRFNNASSGVLHLGPGPAGDTTNPDNHALVEGSNIVFVVDTSTPNWENIKVQGGSSTETVTTAQLYEAVNYLETNIARLGDFEPAAPGGNYPNG